MSNIDDIYIVTKFNDDHHLSQVGDTLIKNENGYFWNNRINMNVGCYPINRIKLTEAIGAVEKVGMASFALDNLRQRKSDIETHLKASRYITGMVHGLQVGILSFESLDKAES